MSEWQSIDTAPKDGTQLLLFCADYDPPFFIGSYGWIELPKDHEDHEDYWEGWTFAEEILANTVELEPEPTHWMHIPATPTEARSAS